MARGEVVPFEFDVRARNFSVPGERPVHLPSGVNVRLIVGVSALRGDGGGVILFYADGGSSGGSLEILRGSGGGVRLRVDWLFGRISEESLLP